MTRHTQCSDTDQFANLHRITYTFTVLIYNKTHVYVKASSLKWVIIFFSYFLTKTYVVGTQNNHLSETGLLSTQNICWNWWVRKYKHFYPSIFCLSWPIMLTWIISLQIPIVPVVFSTYSEFYSKHEKRFTTGKACCNFSVSKINIASCLVFLLAKIVIYRFL